MFTFNNAIPFATHDPSADQPIMLANNIASDGIIAVDHRGYNVNNGGQHTSIHFNQDASYVPAPPVSPPQLFTETLDGKIALKYYSGDLANTSDQYVVSGTSGSTMLLGGIIIKWFPVVFGGVAVSQTETFVAHGVNDFPKAAFGAFLSASSSSVTAAAAIIDKTSITVRRSSAIVSSTYFVIVIGN